MSLSISLDNIKVGYITDDGYVSGVSIADANAYEKLNPETVFIFIDGDKKVKYLSISEVNNLTIRDLLRSDPCEVGPQPCGPPALKFFGGGGIGAEANPVVDSSGNLIAVDLISGGFGYTTPPFVQVIDPCRNGSGAVLTTEILNGVVVRVIINETGSGYLPPKSSVPQYPAILQLSDVCEPFGKISGVKILKAGNFTDLPTIRMKTKTGVNAAFTPVFDVVRDPVPVEPVISDIVQVFDLVGLNVNGFIGGKEYYGNVYFENGVKFAGTSAKSGTDIRVFETREASISGVNVPVARVQRVDEEISVPTVTTDVITAEPDVVEPSTFTTAPAPTVDPTPTSTPTTTPTSDPTPSPAPDPTPYTPPDTGGGGGYGY
jgi:hypothetical protein